jgi:hypothetical protein
MLNPQALQLRVGVDVGSQGKEMKRQINTQWIYPPAGTSKQIFAAIQSPVVDRQALAGMFSV